MADDLLPLLGHNIGGEDDDESNGENDDVDIPTNQSEGEEEISQKENKKKKKQSSELKYDVTLTGEHSYLGDDLEELRGRTIHDDDSFLDLPLLPLSGVILMPGQTIPLKLFQYHTVAMVRNVARSDKTLGLITSMYSEEDSALVMSTTGTTAEIYSMKYDEDERSGISVLHVKAKGRQRFDVIESRRQATGTLIGKVRILPEQVLGDVLRPVRSDREKRMGSCQVEQDSALQTAVDREGRVLMNVRTAPKKIDRFSNAYMTWWPPWVYKSYDTGELMLRIKKELRSWNENLKAEMMPIDAIEFSFWVAQNLPVDDKRRLYLLRLDCAVQRLRYELQLMQTCTMLVCRECGQRIAHKNDVFSMSVEGPMGAYVNPGGFVHETFTVHKADGLTLIGRPSTENSWFPGYAWTIIQCRQCANHMGWRFTAVKKKLVPEKFWGLCRSSLVPGIQGEGDDGDAEHATEHV